jgi:putative intracellular protease/amidase
VNCKRKKTYRFSNAKSSRTDRCCSILLEDALENGASYSSIEDWHPYAVQDGLLITGQNPASSKLVAEKLLHQLNTKVRC